MILINDYPIDCVMQETHDRENEATKYPVESGATITDHVQKKPVKVSLEGIVSDTPIGEMKTIRESDRPADESPLVGAVLSVDTGLGSNSAVALQKLIEVWEKKEPITITTTLGEYRNMIPISLNIPRTKEHTGMLQFTATFEQTTIVTNVRTAIAIAQPTSGFGDKSTTPALLKGTRCIKRNASGSCSLSEVLKRGPDGQWRHPNGTIVTKQQLDQWSEDMTNDPSRRFDPQKGTWVDKKGKPVARDPDQVYNPQKPDVANPDNPWDQIDRVSRRASQRENPQPQNPKPSGK